MSGIITVELSDGSNFKFSFAPTTLASDIVQSCVDKARLTAASIFGLVVLPLDANSLLNELERVFLISNGVPLMEQGVKSGDKVQLAVKYPVFDKIDDERTLDCIFLEVCKRYCKLPSRCELSTETAVNLACLIFQAKTAKSPSFRVTMDLIAELMPKQHSAVAGKETEIFKELTSRFANLKQLTFVDAIKRVLTELQLSVPFLFQHYFLGLHQESVTPLMVGLSMNGIEIRNSNFEQLSFLTNQSVKSIRLVKDKLSKPLEFPQEEESQSNAADIKKRAVKTIRGMMNSSRKSAAASSTKGANDTAQTMSEVMSMIDKTHKFYCSFQMSKKRFSDISIVVYSKSPEPNRMAELFAEHKKIAAQLNGIGSIISLFVTEGGEIVEDPQLTADKIKCFAAVEHKPQVADELALSPGQEIVLLQKRGHGVFYGESCGSRGTFSAKHVCFPLSKDETAKSIASLRGTLNESRNSLGGGPGRLGTNEILTIYLLDHSKMKLLVSSKTTGAHLREQVVDKIELIDQEFFELADCSAGFDRWLDHSIPVLQQNVNPSSKLVFKARCILKDISEITDAKAVHLYFIQVNQAIIDDQLNINENEIAEFASYQMQAILGDHDPARHKPGYLDDLSNYLPKAVAKSLSSKSNYEWQKKIFAMHESYVGLPVFEAEKFYVSLAEKKEFYGYISYSTFIPDVTLAVTRTGVSAVDRSNGTLSEEQYVFNGNLISWSNVSLKIEMFAADSKGEQQRIIFQMPNAIYAVDQMDYVSTGLLDLQLKKKSRDVRNAFKALGKTALVPSSVKNPDPQCLIEQLKDGVLLCQTLALVIPPDDIKFTSKVDLTKEAACENLNIFNHISRTHLGLSEGQHFIAQDLQDAHPRNLTKIFGTILEILRHEKFDNVLKSHAAASRRHSSSTGGSNMKELVLKELLTTEKSYVKDLETMLAQIVRPVQDNNLLQPEDIKLVFSNLENLTSFHESFSKGLEAIAQGPDTIKYMAQSFLNCLPQFESLYQEYCTNQSSALERLAALKDDPVLNEYYTTVSVDALWQSRWSSSLIKPVQRILKYHLLLRELVKFSNNDEPCFPVLEEALEGMMNVATNINEIKRNKELEQALLNLTSNLIEYEGPDLTSYGALLHHGQLTMIDKQAKKNATIKDVGSLHYYLFVDALLYFRESVSSKNKQTFKLRGLILTTVMNVVNHEAETDFEIERADQNKSIGFVARSAEEKERWVMCLKEAIKKSNENVGANVAKYGNLSKSVQPSSASLDVNDLDSMGKLDGRSTFLRMFGTEKRRISREKIDTISENNSSIHSSTTSLGISKLESYRQIRYNTQQDVNGEVKTLAKLPDTFSEIIASEESLMEEYINLRIQAKLIEQEVTKEKFMIKLLEERLVAETAARTQLTQILHQNLTHFREIHHKVKSYTDKHNKVQSNHEKNAKDLEYLVKTTPTIARNASNSSIKG